VNAALAARTQELETLRDAALLIEESVDVTTATGVRAQGGRHPLTTIQEQIADVFVALGYQLAEGPEIESEWLNFDALNIAPDHPARTMQDTFFIGSEDSGIVLRTHTSPVQIRSMLNRELPIYVICPGRVFRTDELDSTHSPVFHQVEGLVIDKGLVYVRHTSRSLNHQLKLICSVSFAVALPLTTQMHLAALVEVKAGSSGVAAAWSIQRF
jgi:phenylalanyl-tRNA synthetase alpha chain